MAGLALVPAGVLAGALHEGPMPTLTDTQLVLLSAASQRTDGLLAPPEKLAGGARQRIVAALLDRGFATEVTADRDAPHWRINEDDRPLGLRITPVGLAALGIDADTPDTTTEGLESLEVATRPIAAPRTGSKLATVLALLARPEGAALDDLTAVTGWLPHTVRAALTCLRKKGHAVGRTRDADGRSTYRLTPVEC